MLELKNTALVRPEDLEALDLSLHSYASSLYDRTALVARTEGRRAVSALAARRKRRIGTVESSPLSLPFRRRVCFT